MLVHDSQQTVLQSSVLLLKQGTFQLIRDVAGCKWWVYDPVTEDTHMQNLCASVSPSAIIFILDHQLSRFDRLPAQCLVLSSTDAIAGHVSQ